MDVTGMGRVLRDDSGDILAMFSLRKQFRWVAKRVLFAIPFLGWMMAMAGYIGIKRGFMTTIHSNTGISPITQQTDETEAISL